MLSLNQITLRAGTKVLLDLASIRIDRGYKVGLVGRNGTGKTSLFKLLQGQLHEDHGEVHLGQSTQLASLNQELPQTTDHAFSYVQSADEEWVALKKKIDEAEQSSDGMILAELYHQMELIDGYRIEAKVANILNGLGFKADEFKQAVSDFSGGWQMRLQLARLLMSKADFLLLDEPTNHLDLESILWLEKWLKSYSGTAIIISHDRQFLDQTCTHTIHLSNQKLKIYSGGYSQFAQQLEQDLILQQKANEKVLKQKAHLQSYVDRFKAKASKAKQAQSRVKAIEKLKISAIFQERDIQFQFFESDECGYPTISINATMGYPGHTVLEDVKLNVGDGDRIGVIGHNGSGKSTLFKSLAGALPTLKGDVDCHPKIKIGYFSQQQLDLLDLEANALVHLLRQDPSLSETQARTYLGRFGFSYEKVFDPVKKFSGGERARLALALLIWDRPNVLILDEPTNHLDMSIRESLIMALQDFKGALLVVSHDRYFIECCANELWQVKNHQVSRYLGSLSDYEKEEKTTMQVGVDADKKKTA